MFSNMLAKRAILLNKQVAVRGFALNNSHLQSALKDPAHLNWSQFFAGVRASDVAGSDNQSIANLLKVLSHLDAESKEAQDQTELFNAVNEYFRLKFRKLSG